MIRDLLARQAAIRARLDAFLRLPSVGADPAFAEDMAATRGFLLDWLRDIGLANARLLEGGGQPAVYASWEGAPGRPTLLIYGHYDVQPPAPLDHWRTPPFEPTEIEGRLYARGASDVKGSTTIAIEVIAAYLRAGGCPVNVKLFLEGEEETGSPSLRRIVEQHRDLLAADAMISADGGRASPARATVNVGARGSTASSLPPGHPLLRAGTKVWQVLTGQEPVPVRLGATVPVTAIFKDMLGIETLMFGFNLPDEDVHAPNEFFHLESIPLGLRGWAMLLAELGTTSPEAFDGVR